MRLEEIFQKVPVIGEAYLTFSQPENFYLTGFRSTFGVTVVTAKGDALFLTDGRYFEEAKKQVKNFKLVLWKGWETLKEVLKGLSLESVSVDPSRLSLANYRKLQEFIQVVEAPGFISQFRARKTPREISLITRAVQIAELSLKSVLHLLKPGITELEFRRELINAFFKFGGEGEAFPTIVASGPGSAIPHWQTSNREIKDGDVVIVDFGTVYGGYVSDITRTFLVGNVPSQMKEVYTVVKEAQELGVSLLKAGKACKEMDSAVREFIASKGYGEFFVHSLGHGIGIEVHEAPTLSIRSDQVLQEGNVVTVEPGIYIPELGGVRIEDDCLVTVEGSFLISHVIV